MSGTRLSRDDPTLAEVLKEVRRIDVQTRRLVTGTMAGGYLSVFRGSGIEFDTVREYDDGDDPRSIDWNVTARMGRPFVKTYVDERELTILFLLDLSASMGGGFALRSARQTAARVAACLAFSAVRNGDKVGLVAFSEGVDTWVPPRKGVAHALRIVRDCLAHPAASATTRLAPALDFATHAVRRHAVLFVLSDFLTTGWERPLALCAKRHDVIAVRLLLPELEAPPGRGLLRLEDPETKARLLFDGSSRRAREAWRRRVEAWRADTDRSLRRARVDVMDVRVPTKVEANGVAEPILAFFRMREQRGAKR